jgi:hypothetical protein
MRRLQLYIENQRVDLFKDESVSLTQTIKNVKDIAKVFTEFTKSFSVPASSVNNKIFQHYYNFDISGGFDARIKVDARLELNDLPFKIGKISLQGVDLKNNLAHTYRINFFGNTVNLKDIFADEELSALTFTSSFNQDYSYSNVLNDLQATTYGDICIPLITHTDRMFYDSSNNNNVYGNVYPASGLGLANGINWNEFKYGVGVLAIINAIESKYNITFSDDFFYSANPNGLIRLYMWLHRKSGAVEVVGQVNPVYTLLQDLYTTNAQLNVSSVTNGAITINAVDVTTGNNPFFWSFQDMTIGLTPTVTNEKYGLQVLRNGTIIAELNNVEDVQTLTIPAAQILNNRTYTFQFTSINNIAFAANNIVITINARKNFTSGGGGISNEVDVYKNLALFQTNQFSEFNISQQMPKMKVIDFLSGLFKLFNLVSYVENDIIVVKTLDDYYASSTQVYNIDKYLDTTKSTTNVALPFNQINFQYKGLKSFLANQFNEITNSGWGSLGFTLDGDIFDAPSEAYKIEVPFEHFMYERLYDAGISPSPSTTVQWGYSVNNNQQPYKGEPLLFYRVIQEDEDTIRIRDEATGGISDIDTYSIPSNSLNLNTTQSKYNLHFQNEMNEYLANEPNTLVAGNNPLGFTDTLFETEYKAYIQGVFAESMRLTKVTAYLPMKIYYNLGLNDLIEINQQTYKINSLTTDLTTGKTEFELLNNIIL